MGKDGAASTPTMAELLAVGLIALSLWFVHRRIQAVSDLYPLIRAAADRYKVPAPLIAAIIDVESGGRSVKKWEPSIKDYAWGVMQVTTGTARYMGYTGDPEGLLDPAVNIDIGTRYLKYQLVRYRWNLVQAISAYNAGSYTPRNVGYVNRVLKRMEYWARRMASWGSGR